MEKQKLILEMSMNLFKEKGYKNTTIDIIAKECNMGKGTFYIYYKSKEEILEAIVENQLIIIRETNTKVFSSDLLFHEQMEIFLREVLKLSDEQSLIGNLVREAKSINGDVLKKQIARFEENIINKIELNINKAIDLGYILPCDSKFNAFLVYKIYMLVIIEYGVLENKKIKEKEFFELLEKLFKK